MRRTILLTTTTISLALSAGCAAAVPHLDGVAAPAGAATPSRTPVSAPPSSVPVTPVPSTSPSPSRPTSSPAQPTAEPSPPAPTRTPTNTTPRPSTATPLVLGPTGLGELKIGMTRAQAKATGLIVASGDSAVGCSYSVLRGAPRDAGEVTHSARLGVIAISGYGAMRTPEGIGIGSSLSAVKRAYSDLTFSPVEDAPFNGTGRVWADIHDGDKVSYRMSFSDNRVAELGLEHVDQDCYE